jgi:hypothetical protein
VAKHYFHFTPQETSVEAVPEALSLLLVEGEGKKVLPTSAKGFTLSRWRKEKGCVIFSEQHPKQKKRE